MQDRKAQKTRGEKRKPQSHLFKRRSIDENPAKLNDFGRVLGDVNAMFVASGRDVDDDITVGVESRMLRLLDGHDGQPLGGCRVCPAPCPLRGTVSSEGGGRRKEEEEVAELAVSRPTKDGVDV